MTEAALLAIEHQVLWAALALGTAFGALAQRTHFCTMGALADVVQSPRFATSYGLLLEALTQRKRGLKVRETRDVKELFGRMKSWFEKNF